MQITRDDVDRTVTITTFNPIDVVKKHVEPEATFAYWYNQHARSAYEGQFVFRFTVDAPKPRRWWQIGLSKLLWGDCEWFQLRMTEAELLNTLGYEGHNKYPIIGFKNIKFDSDYKTQVVTISGQRMGTGVGLKVKLK